MPQLIRLSRSPRPLTQTALPVASRPTVHSPTLRRSPAAASAASRPTVYRSTTRRKAPAASVAEPHADIVSSPTATLDYSHSPASEVSTCLHHDAEVDLETLPFNLQSLLRRGVVNNNTKHHICSIIASQRTHSPSSAAATSSLIADRMRLNLPVLKYQTVPLLVFSIHHAMLAVCRQAMCTLRPALVAKAAPINYGREREYTAESTDEQEIRERFFEFDVDGSDSIDADELRLLISSMFDEGNVLSQSFIQRWIESRVLVKNESGCIDKPGTDSDESGTAPSSLDYDQFVSVFNLAVAEFALIIRAVAAGRQAVRSWVHVEAAVVEVVDGHSNDALHAHAIRLWSHAALHATRMKSVSLSQLRWFATSQQATVKQQQLSSDEDAIVERFYEFDIDQSGSIDVHELHTFVQTLFGDDATEDNLRCWTQRTINEMDTAVPGVLEYDEFVLVHNKAIHELRTGTLQ